MQTRTKKAKAAPISRSDLENSFYTWQMSYPNYMYFERKSQDFADWCPKTQHDHCRTCSAETQAGERI